MDADDGLFHPFPSQDNNDGILQYLEFADPDYDIEPIPPPAPAVAEYSVEAPNIVRPDEFPDLSFLDNFDNNDFDGAIPSSEIPVDGGSSSSMPQDFLDCSGCQVLREVVHTNGFQNMKLSIHGGPGVFYHATLDVYHNSEGFPPAMQQSYVDFGSQNYQCVKQFLIDYGLLRVRDNFVVLQDSLSSFYDVLCTNMNHADAEGGGFNNSGPDIPSSGLSQSRNVEENQGLPIVRSALAMQRERTGRLQLSEIAGYFHLPINDAAKELDICPTALKRICRKYGIARWPHRKIRSVDRKILRLRQGLRTQFGEEAERAKNEIERLKTQKDRICARLA